MRLFMLNFLWAPKRVSTIFHHFLQKLCRKKVKTCSILVFRQLGLWIHTGLCYPSNAVMFNRLIFARSQASLLFRSWQTPEAALRCWQSRGRSGTTAPQTKSYYYWIFTVNFHSELQIFRSSFRVCEHRSYAFPKEKLACLLRFLVTF